MPIPPVLPCTIAPDNSRFVAVPVADIVPVPMLGAVAAYDSRFISVSMTETIPVPVLATIVTDNGGEVIVSVTPAVPVPAFIPVSVKDLCNAVTMIDGAWRSVKELITSYALVFCTGDVLAQDLFDGVGHSLTTECACH